MVFKGSELGESLIKRGKSKEFWGILQSFYALAIILVIRIYACVKICRPVHQTVNFTLCNSEN